MRRASAADVQTVFLTRQRWGFFFPSGVKSFRAARGRTFSQTFGRFICGAIAALAVVLTRGAASPPLEIRHGRVADVLVFLVTPKKTKKHTPFCPPL